MDRLLEVLIIVVIAGATLAFGGVHPITYSLAEIVLFSGVLLLLIRQVRQGRISLPLPIWPALFVLWAVFELIPLPSSLVSVLCPARLAVFKVDGLPGAHGAFTTMSIDPHDTTVSLLRFLGYLSVFLLAAYVSDARKKKNVLVSAIIGLGVFEAGYGIVQYLTGWQKIFTYTKIFDIHEATGTYINRNHYAGLLEMILPFILASAFYSFQKRSEQPRADAGGAALIGSSAGFRALFNLFLLAILCLALIFSRSRGGILASLISLLFIALLGQVKIRSKGWMLAVVLLLTLVVGYGFWIGLNPVLARFEQIGEKGYFQVEARTGIWNDTRTLVREYPVTGTGLGTFAEAYRRVQTVVLDKYVDHAHNDYLEFLSETGVVGLALLFLPIFFLFVRMVIVFLNDPHRYRRSLLLGCIGSSLALLIHSVMDFNLQIPANALVFALVLGIGYKTSRVGPREEALQR